jgi:hypothetical protein
VASIEAVSSTQPVDSLDGPQPAPPGQRCARIDRGDPCPQRADIGDRPRVHPMAPTRGFQCHISLVCSLTHGLAESARTSDTDANGVEIYPRLIPRLSLNAKAVSVITTGEVDGRRH